MSDTVIKVENLSKQYRIGAKEGYRTFRETLVDSAKAPFYRVFNLFNRKSKIENRKLNDSMLPAPGSLLSSSDDTFWALKDVSFEVKRGEVVGIIGRNGAGKSTLLKILSKITEPTKGRVELRGRVGSLLEVGTGFHPELTGHENIYLYGAILGMDRWEISGKFDEIVAFAELEKFINTPVKRYSSGMYMRLAFAVAAHLESEILLVDEVLAVGDAAFQKKCLGKMGDVSKQGRTVLFVSHNMGAIEELCGQVMCLESGRIANSGSTRQVIASYFGTQNFTNDNIVCLKDRKRGKDFSGELRFESVWTELANGQVENRIQLEQPFSVCFSYRVTKAFPGVLIAFRIETLGGQIIIDSWNTDSNEESNQKPGVYQVRAKIDPQDLHPGLYQISLLAAIHMVRWFDKVDSALQIEVLPFGPNRVWRSERKAILARIVSWVTDHKDA